MKSKDLRERSSADLTQLREMMKKDLFSYRMKNLTNQLDDTSLLRKTRRDIAGKAISHLSEVVGAKAHEFHIAGDTIGTDTRPRCFHHGANFVAY